jgi:hypothetical protein
MKGFFKGGQYMMSKRLALVGIILALLVMIVSGIGLYRLEGPGAGDIPATIVYTDTDS